MNTTFKEALKKRHSCYALTPNSPLPSQRIEEMLAFALQNVPSAFNSQSTRLVLLLGEHYQKLWRIVLETLRKLTPPDAFPGTEVKIKSFAGGVGTVLFYEDQAVVEKLQSSFPLYKDNFPAWSQHTSAMHQLAVWTMLADAGLGASLQHYNPIIDDEVAQAWNIDPKWKLVAQMPFGGCGDHPAAKEKLPLSATLKIFS